MSAQTQVDIHAADKLEKAKRDRLAFEASTESASDQPLPREVLGAVDSERSKVRAAPAPLHGRLNFGYEAVAVVLRIVCEIPVLKPTGGAAAIEREPLG